MTSNDRINTARHAIMSSILKQWRKTPTIYLAIIQYCTNPHTKVFSCMYHNKVGNISYKLNRFHEVTPNTTDCNYRPHKSNKLA